MPNDALGNTARGLEAAQARLGIAPLLSPADLANPMVDELSVSNAVGVFLIGDRSFLFCFLEAR